jgi:hypothetical protein
MNFKQSHAGRIYIRAITKNHFLFPIIILAGIAIIILLLINVKIDVIQTYTVKVNSNNTITVNGQLSLKPTTQKTMDIYLYTDKNTEIHKVSGSISSDLTNTTIITFISKDSKLENFMQIHKGGQINADIAIRQISLLKRIFSR